MAKTNKAKNTGSTGQTAVKAAYGLANRISGLANRISAQTKARASNAASTGAGIQSSGSNTQQLVSKNTGQVVTDRMPVQTKAENTGSTGQELVEDAYVLANRNTTQDTAQDAQNNTQDVQQYIQSYVPSVDFMSVYNDYASRMNNILQQQKDALNQSSTSKARGAYVSNEQNKAAIPQVLSNAGITGGLAEKIRANQNTSYQQNLANILSENATQGAELERNNANLINEAYKEAMSNQQSVDNERALAAQQYANQLALQQQQQAYEAEQQKQSNLMSELQNAASSYTNILDNKGKMVSSTANQLSALKKDLASRGADAATLAAADSYIVAAASARYDQVYGSKKNPSMTKQEYLQKYAYNRM